KRMQQDGVGLHDAALALAPTQDVVLLDNGQVALRIKPTSQGKASVVLMESGRGNRGPPPPGAQVSFVIGALDGAPHRPGSAETSRRPVVRVSILPEAEAAPLIAK